MQFQTPYNRTPSLPEINCGITQTEKAGYIPAKNRIENMMLAGQRLIAHRAEMYDINSDKEFNEDFPVDPTRSKNFDLADAFVISQNLENNKKQRDILKASQAASDASDKVGEGEEGRYPLKRSGLYFLLM